MIAISGKKSYIPFNKRDPIQNSSSDKIKHKLFSRLKSGK